MFIIENNTILYTIVQVLYIDIETRFETMNSFKNATVYDREHNKNIIILYVLLIFNVIRTEDDSWIITGHYNIIVEINIITIIINYTWVGYIYLLCRASGCRLRDDGKKKKDTKNNKKDLFPVNAAQR